MANPDASSTVLEILRKNDANNEDSAMLIPALKDAFIAAGFDADKELEKAIVPLIDMDEVEYDMDENGQATALWLIDSEQYFA